MTRRQERLTGRGSAVVPLAAATWLICMCEGQGSCVEMGPQWAPCQQSPGRISG